MRILAMTLLGILMPAAAGVSGPTAAGPAARGNSPLKNPETLESGATLTTVNYAIPDVMLVRSDGKSVSLPDELNDGRPVVMSFIFTTCTTICPLSSQTFQKLQSMLGADRKRVHMVSISIDPEEDTPARLATYAKGYKAGAGWSFYTGTVQAIIATQQAFGVYRGDKMNHTPVTLMRAAPGKPWIRIDGFATADDLLRQVRSMSSASN